ncbi:MAG: hypothetical protein PVH30_07525 [Desulfobacterales bacterium]|jgi:hypothetical protein
MPAATPDELRSRLSADPYESPSALLADDSFASWCYDHLSLRELKSAFHRDPDPQQCDQWQLNQREWRQQVEMALIARSAVRGDPF